MRRIKSFRLSFIWFLFILLLVSIPGAYIPNVQTFSEWLQWDKLTHLVLFGGFSFLLMIGFWKDQGTINLKMYCIAIFISILYGAFTEWWQKYVCISRDGNLFDFYADTLGAVLGGLVFRMMKKTIQQRISNNQ